MSRIKYIYFTDRAGNERAAMAAALFQKMYPNAGVSAYARGLIVSFPEPMNQKVEAVMAGGGIVWDDFTSKALQNEEITEDSLVLVMDERQKDHAIKALENATVENTFVLSKYVGEELDIMDPYGGNLQTYGICFEGLKETLGKLQARLEEDLER